MTRRGLRRSDQRRERHQRRGGVVGRQEHAAPREGRAFFEVQVGDDERAALRQPQRAGRIDDDLLAGDPRAELSHAGAPAVVLRFASAPGVGRGAGAARRGRGCGSSGGSPMASRISASAASARMSLRASPGTCSLLISSMIGTASGETRDSL